MLNGMCTLALGPERSTGGYYFDIAAIAILCQGCPCPDVTRKEPGLPSPYPVLVNKYTMPLCNICCYCREISTRRFRLVLLTRNSLPNGYYIFRSFVLWLCLYSFLNSLFFSVTHSIFRFVLVSFLCCKGKTYHPRDSSAVFSLFVFLWFCLFVSLSSILPVTSFSSFLLFVFVCFY